jgi:DNA-binding CsgD family transcriptional regulator/PAS domain-containing protein
MRSKDDLLRLIDLIYEAAADIRGWAAALVAIAGTLGAPAATMTIADPDGKNAHFHVAPRTDPAWARVFADRWSSTNVLRERGLMLPDGAVYQYEDLMPRPEFEHTVMYNEFLAPQHLDHMLASNALKSAAGVAGICFYRDAARGPFDTRETRLLQALAPHLQRAVMLNLELGRLRIERDSAVELLNRCEHAVILVDTDGRVLFANATAETLLHDGSGLIARGGRLASSVVAKTTELRRLIAGDKNGHSGGLMTLPCLDGHNLTALVLPLPAETTWLAHRPSAIVFVRDPASAVMPSADQLRVLFGLTPAQAALAREMLAGDGIEAAAGRLGIARATARTHLLEVFEKTGARRQAELVRVLLQHAPPARLSG